MYSVLIVDDDKLARKGLIAITDWAKCGMQVVGDVANGKLAMDFLAEHQVDLVVVDMVMPVMNGLEFIRESSRLYPQLQYVMLSFHEDFEYVKSALRLGALETGMCYLGIAIFLGYTAYDTSKIRENYLFYAGNAALLKKASIYSALQLYLDFVNLFLYIMRILGRRRD